MALSLLGFFPFEVLLDAAIKGFFNSVNVEEITVATAGFTRAGPVVLSSFLVMLALIFAIVPVELFLLSLLGEALSQTPFIGLSVDVHMGFPGSAICSSGSRSKSMSITPKAVKPCEEGGRTVR